MNKSSKNLVLAAVIGLVAMAPLHALAANKLIVTDNLTPANPQFVVNERGFIGVGTTTPNSAVSVQMPDVLSGQINSRVVQDNSTGGGGFTAYANRVTLGSNGGLPLNGDRLGYFLFGSLSSQLDQFGSFIPLNGAGISAVSEGDYTLSVSNGGATQVKNMPSAFAFQTSPANSNGRIERFRITSTGTVGVNTNAPQATLDVNGGLRLNPTFNASVNGIDNSNAGVPPACTVNNRGTIWFTPGTTDSLQICASKSGNPPQWYAVTF